MGLGAALGVGSSLLGVAGSLGGAAIQAGASEDATKAQEAMFNQVQADLAPYMAAGGKGTNQLLNLLGLGPQGQAGIFSTLTSTPGYNFQFGQGQQSLLDATAATGGVRGGNTLKALMSYGQGQAQTGYQQAVSNYGGLASLGENAAAGAGNNAASFAPGIAAGITGTGNALSAGLVGATNAFQQNNILSSILGAGGGGNYTYNPTNTGDLSQLAGLY